MNALSTPGRLLLAMIIAAIAIGAGVWAARAVLDSAAPPDTLSATRFPVARQLQPFRLVDHHSRPFDNQALQGHWTFLFFGYTHCPDVCPTTLSVLNGVAQRLAGSGASARFAFVSVDPQRDTPEQLARFVTYFNGDFIGVTGEPGAIEQLTRQLGVLHMEVRDDANPNSYLVDHTASVFLVDPDGRYHAVFTPPLDAGTISADFHNLLEDYS
ncbi:MAG: SCO family protein [Gammaproteobacteria bacterium]|jgi:protein SCO1/2